MKKRIYSQNKSLLTLLAFDSIKSQCKPTYASELEERLSADPNSFELRCKLVAAYYVDEKKEVIPHLMWFVEHYATKPFISNSFFHFQQNAETQPLMDLWRKKIVEKPTHVDLLINFVYVVPDKKQADEVFETLKKLHPEHLRVKKLIRFLKESNYP